MQWELTVPARRHRRMWNRFRAAFDMAGERHVPGLGNAKTYATYLRRVRQYKTGRRLPAGHVPASQYFLLDQSKREILGVIDIRHSLNEHLLHRGGHIGYAVAPSQRRRGYGTLQLRLALDVCRNMGLERVLITCDSDNTASAKTIERCGGILEDERLDASGVPFKRYWVHLRWC